MSNRDYLESLTEEMLVNKIEKTIVDTALAEVVSEIVNKQEQNSILSAFDE